MSVCPSLSPQPPRCRLSATVVELLQHAIVGPTSSDAPTPPSSAGRDISSTSLGENEHYRCEEERWILDRLIFAANCPHDEREAKSTPAPTASTCEEQNTDPIGALGTLQLRRVLRAIGLPTVGTQQAVLAERLREAVQSGQAASYADKTNSTAAGPNQCVVQARKAKATLALVESLLSGSTDIASMSVNQPHVPSSPISDEPTISSNESGFDIPITATAIATANSSTDTGDDIMSSTSPIVDNDGVHSDNAPSATTTTEASSSSNNNKNISEALSNTIADNNTPAISTTTTTKPLAETTILTTAGASAPVPVPSSQTSSTTEAITSPNAVAAPPATVSQSSTLATAEVPATDEPPGFTSTEPVAAVVDGDEDGGGVVVKVPSAASLTSTTSVTASETSLSSSSSSSPSPPSLPSFAPHERTPPKSAPAGATSAPVVKTSGEDVEKSTKTITPSRDVTGKTAVTPVATETTASASDVVDAKGVAEKTGEKTTVASNTAENRAGVSSASKKTGLPVQGRAIHTSPWGSSSSARFATTSKKAPMPAPAPAAPKGNPWRRRQAGGGRVAALIGNFDAKSKEGKAKVRDVKDRAKEVKDRAVGAMKDKRSSTDLKEKARDAKAKAKGWTKTKVEIKIVRVSPGDDGSKHQERQQEHGTPLQASAGVIGGAQQPLPTVGNSCNAASSPAHGAINTSNPGQSEGKSNSGNVVPNKTADISPTADPEVDPQVAGEIATPQTVSACPKNGSHFEVPTSVYPAYSPGATTPTTKETTLAVDTSTKRGWGPPKAAPLTKSISTPVSPTPSIASASTMSLSPPPSPRPGKNRSAGSSACRKLFSPSTSGTANSSTQCPSTTTSTTANALPKSRWGPPSATPYLVNSVSSPEASRPGGVADVLPGSSPSGSIPSLPKKPSPPSSFSKKVPAGASTAVGGGGGKAPPLRSSRDVPTQSASNDSNGSNSPSPPSSAASTTAAPPKSKGQATPTPNPNPSARSASNINSSNNTEPQSATAPPTKSALKKLRPPPPSSPAPPVPQRLIMAQTTPATAASGASQLGGCYNPLLPSKLVGGSGGARPAIGIATGTASSIANSMGGGLKRVGKKAGGGGATVGFSTSGPRLPAPPKATVVANAAVSGGPLSPVQQPPLFQGKEIMVDYGFGAGDGHDSDSDGGEEHESDDEYHVGESGSSEEEDDDPVLKLLEPAVMPEWARSKAVAEALQRQFGGDTPVNPNHIFVDFFTCNLENIFDTKKKKWNRRSTGDWRTDRLTIAEKLAYDRAMGYVTIEPKYADRSARNSSSRRSRENC